MLLLGSSCIKDNIVDYPCHDAVLSLAITNAGDATRADGDDASLVDNDDEYNEDAIKNVDIFLYTASATNGTPATKHVSLNFDTREQCNVSQSLNNQELEALGLTSNGATCKAYIIVNAPATISALADGAEGTSVTALTNTVVTTSFGETADWGTGKFGDVDLETGEAPEIMLNSIKPQEKFVMDSEVVELTYDKDQRTIGREESVKVIRAASKIRLTVTLADEIVIGEDTWVPNIEGMTVAFYNGVKSATIGKVEDPEDRTDSEHTGDFFNVSGIQFLTPGVQGGTPGGFQQDDNGAEGSSVTRATSAVTHITPFYTYPSAWTTDLEENDAARFELVVPWGIKKTNNWDIDYMQYRYSVPINMADKKIERNKFYNINLHIGVLGNLNYLDPLTYSFHVTEWNSEDIDVNLQKPQYLTVEKNYIEVYNQDTFGVAYEASDEIEAVITKVVKPNYTGNSAVEDNVVYPTNESETGSKSVTPPQFEVGNSKFGNTNPIKVEVKDGQVVLTHILNNNMSSDDLDYVPYTITVLVTMKLANGQSITEEVVFKQYPAIYLFADQNTDFDNGGGVNADHNTLVNGYYGGGQRTTSVSDTTFVGPESDEKSQVGYYGSVTGLYQSSGTNQNPNQYVITVSSISAGQSYVIGDPRVRDSDTTLVNETRQVQTGGSNRNPTYTDYSVWATGYVVNEKMESVTPNRKLAHYYPTDVRMTGTDKDKPDSYLTGWTIAPKFRIASSYAVVYGIDMMTEYDNAKKRCASYQENGYPAGRWRMPTYAEVAFIASMSDRLMIPRLFNDNTNYWCAHGNFMPTGGEVSLDGDGSSATSIRCVYDEWYWGNKKLANPSQFTWGDTEITW